MTERSTTKREETEHPDARREAQQVDLIRRAAGVDTYIGRGASGYHFGRYVCRDCPDDRHTPPCRPFRLNSHIQQHLAANPTHRVAYFCWDDMEFEDEWLNAGPVRAHQLMDGAKVASMLPIGNTPATERQARELAPLLREDEQEVVAHRPAPRPEMVLAALQILADAGLFGAIDPLVPEPPKLTLLYREKLTLEAIRERPGMTVAELAEAMGLRRQNTNRYVLFLFRGGHIRAEGNWGKGSWKSPCRLYPTHDRPIGEVRPRQGTRFRR